MTELTQFCHSLEMLKTHCFFVYKIHFCFTNYILVVISLLFVKRSLHTLTNFFLALPPKFPSASAFACSNPSKHLPTFRGPFGLRRGHISRVVVARLWRNWRPGGPPENMTHTRPHATPRRRRSHESQRVPLAWRTSAAELTHILPHREAASL